MGNQRLTLEVVLSVGAGHHFLAHGYADAEDIITSLNNVIQID